MLHETPKDYKSLDSNRKDILNLISVDDFKKIMNK